MVERFFYRKWKWFFLIRKQNTSVAIFRVPATHCFRCFFAFLFQRFNFCILGFPSHLLWCKKWISDRFSFPGTRFSCFRSDYRRIRFSSWFDGFGNPHNALATKSRMIDYFTSIWYLHQYKLKHWPKNINNLF